MRYIGVIIVCLLMCSCARRGTVNNEISRGQIRQAVNSQIHFYEKEDRDNFFSSVSQDYYPNYKELEYTIDNFLSANDNIQLEFFIEKVLVSGDAVSADINWDKTYVNKQGAVVRQSGSSVLIFDMSGGRPVLINIKGDNLFTQ